MSGRSNRLSGVTLNPGLRFGASGFEKIKGLRIYRRYLLQIRTPPTFFVSGRFRVSGFGFRVSGFRFQVSRRLGFSDIEEVPNRACVRPV